MIHFQSVILKNFPQHRGLVSIIMAVQWISPLATASLKGNINKWHKRRGYVEANFRQLAVSFITLNQVYDNSHQIQHFFHAIPDADFIHEQHPMCQNPKN